MNRKLLITLFAIGALLLVGTVWLLLSQEDEKTNRQEEATTSLKDVVYVNSLKAHTDDLSSEQSALIQSELYNTTAGNEESPTPYYEGVIRNGSYTKEVINNSEYTIRFIVDIPSVEKSWHVAYYANTSGSKGSTPVIISCVEGSELIYDAFECRDFYDQ